MMHSHKQKAIPLVSMLVVLCLAAVLACGVDKEKSGETVPVNLSLVFDSQQARRATPISMLMAWIGRWLLGPPSAWAQSVIDISRIQVQILAPDLSVPSTASVSVPNPTSGQVIPVSIQAPVGPNRTIAVAALDAAGRKIFSGSASGITLTAGTPLSLEIRLAPTFTVTVVKQGAGNGTVTSSPGGISCPDTCSSRFDAGSSVTLNAAAASGSVFVGWSGAGCSGAASCVVTGNALVTAVFNTAVPTASLTVTRSGTGTGIVTSNPSGISCGNACSADFAVGSTVTLTAVPSGGSTFTGWSGACTGNAPCVVQMNGSRTVDAAFTATPGARLSVAKTGSGNVSSSPAGIDCGSNCSAVFAGGTIVTLTASPGPGSTFGGWNGGGCVGTAPCTIIMLVDQTVTAQFDPQADLVTLEVNKSGSGDGTVTSDPAGINCGPSCVFSFVRGTTVTLTAIPDGQSQFEEWRDGACRGSGSGPCTLLMDRDRTVNARFRN